MDTDYKYKNAHVIHDHDKYYIHNNYWTTEFKMSDRSVVTLHYHTIKCNILKEIQMYMHVMTSYRYNYIRT